jgi:hypothetical protein
MSTQSQDSRDDPFSAQELELIKHSFDRFEKNLGITKETPEHLKSSFERKLAALTPKLPFSVRWKGLSAMLVVAFSMGILISRFLMVPITSATRGVGNEVVSSQLISSHEYVSLQVANPKEFAFKVAAAALDAEMEIEITPLEGKYSLYVKSFVPKAQNQELIRSLLGVKPDVGGTVNAIIGLGQK